MPSPDTRLLVIANPTAGVSAGRVSRNRLLDGAMREFQKAGLQAELQRETDALSVVERAAEGAREGYGRIVAAGGDGTVNAVVNGLMRERDSLHGVRFGVLPMGTGNVFAFNVGLPRSWKAACRVIQAGHARRIDVGVARTVDSGQLTEDRGQTRNFLCMAGIGFDARVIEETSLRLKYVLRDFAYVLKTLQNVVLHQGTQVQLQFGDGKLYANEAWLVMVGNAASYAWDIKVTQHARLDDGMLDVCLMPFENKVVSIQQAMQILTGQHIERGIAHYWKTGGVRIESDPPVPVQLDGDEWAHTPVELSILPGALQVMAPPET